ncbi:MAG TPA: hypothetical protein VD948_08315 [Rhodothermales bacterium]|nr:hypothetical protein [Rhodothermales bacterium]
MQLTTPTDHARALAAWFEAARPTLPPDLWLVPHLQATPVYYERLAARLARARAEGRIARALVAELERLRAAAEHPVAPGVVDQFNDVSRGGVGRKA